MNRHYKQRQRHRQAAGPTPAFLCERCGQVAAGSAPGTRNRNHCPHCLWSLHVDFSPGDRRCGCKGQMEPIAIWVQPNGEWSLMHRCRKCGVLRANRTAGDDSELALISLALRPLAQPPFPLDRLATATRD